MGGSVRIVVWYVWILRIWADRAKGVRTPFACRYRAFLSQRGLDLVGWTPDTRPNAPIAPTFRGRLPMARCVYSARGAVGVCPPTTDPFTRDGAWDAEADSRH